MTKKRHGWWRRLGASIAAVGVFAASGVVVAQAQDDSGVDAGTVGSETVDTPPSSEASTGGLDVPGGVESAPDDGNAEAEEGDIDAADFAGMNDVPDVSRMRSLPDTFGRAAQQAYSTKQLTLVPEANPLAYVDQQGASGGIAPRLRVGTTIGGQRDQTTIRLTELVIRYYPSSPQYDLGGPVEVVKNGNEFCRVGTENIKAVGYARNGKVNQISVDLSSCKPQIGVWEGHNDRVEVNRPEFFGDYG